MVERRPLKLRARGSIPRSPASLLCEAGRCLAFLTLGAVLLVELWLLIGR